MFLLSTFYKPKTQLRGPITNKIQPPTPLPPPCVYMIPRLQQITLNVENRRKIYKQKPEECLTQDEWKWEKKSLGKWLRLPRRERDSPFVKTKKEVFPFSKNRFQWNVIALWSMFTCEHIPQVCGVRVLSRTDICVISIVKSWRLRLQLVAVVNIQRFWLVSK